MNRYKYMIKKGKELVEVYSNAQYRIGEKYDGLYEIQEAYLIQNKGKRCEDYEGCKGCPLNKLNSNLLCVAASSTYMITENVDEENSFSDLSIEEIIKIAKQEIKELEKNEKTL